MWRQTHARRRHTRTHARKTRHKNTVKKTSQQSRRPPQPPEKQKGAGHPTSGVQPLTTNPPRILGKRITGSQKVENGIIPFSRLTIHTTQRPSSPTQRQYSPITPRVPHIHAATRSYAQNRASPTANRRQHNSQPDAITCEPQQALPFESLSFLDCVELGLHVTLHTEHRMISRQHIPQRVIILHP